jgi:hypothetical protein
MKDELVSALVAITGVIPRLPVHAVVAPPDGEHAGVTLVDRVPPELWSSRVQTRRSKSPARL